MSSIPRATPVSSPRVANDEHDCCERHGPVHAVGLYGRGTGSTKGIVAQRRRRVLFASQADWIRFRGQCIPTQNESNPFNYNGNPHSFQNSGLHLENHGALAYFNSSSLVPVWNRKWNSP